jgi:acyl-CoA synthetase (AMP-forming)/AMP-acid ligase II
MPAQDYPAIIFSLFKLAVPVSFIPSLLTPAESAALLQLSCATTLFVSPRLLHVALAAAKLTGLRDDRIFVLGGRVTGRKSFSDLIAAVRAKGVRRVPTASVKDDTVAYMVFSSGTSGLPKGKRFQQLCFYGFPYPYIQYVSRPWATRLASYASQRIVFSTASITRTLLFEFD